MVPGCPRRNVVLKKPELKEVNLMSNKVNEKKQIGGARRGFSRAVGGLSALLALTAVTLAPSAAEARETCRSKPAVCARLAHQKQQAKQATASATDSEAASHGKVVQRPSTNVYAVARCTSKPAVCSRLRAQEDTSTMIAEKRTSQEATMAAQAAEATVAAQRAPEAAHTFKRCTTKPAVCSRLRGQR